MKLNFKIEKPERCGIKESYEMKFPERRTKVLWDQNTNNSVFLYKVLWNEISRMKNPSMSWNKSSNSSCPYVLQRSPVKWCFKNEETKFEVMIHLYLPTKSNFKNEEPNNELGQKLECSHIHQSYEFQEWRTTLKVGTKFEFMMFPMKFRKWKIKFESNGFLTALTTECPKIDSQILQFSFNP